MYGARAIPVVLSVAAGLVAVGARGAAPAPEQESPATLVASVPGSAVSVGDRVPVRVTVHGGDGWQWGDLVVEASERWAVVAPPHGVAGSSPPVWELVLAPLVVGESALPAMGVTARPPAGDPVQVALGAPPRVTVASVLPPGEEDAKPAPLRDPLGARGFPWEWILPWALVATPLVAAGVWWGTRRRRRLMEAGGASPLPPLAELEGRLTELETALARAVPTAPWCDGLAAAFRRFLERRSGAPACEMTSFELRGLARRERWPETVQRALHRVMTVVDGVRFSRLGCADGELTEVLGAARSAARTLDAHLAAAEAELEEAS